MLWGQWLGYWQLLSEKMWQYGEKLLLCLLILLAALWLLRVGYGFLIRYLEFRSGSPRGPKP